MGVDKASIDKIIDDSIAVLDANKASISGLLSVFGKLISNIDSNPTKEYTDNYVKECQFAIVYRYIDVEKKSDRLTFKNNSNVNAKATDFVNGSTDIYVQFVTH